MLLFTQIATAWVGGEAVDDGKPGAPHHPRERIPSPVHQAYNRDSSRRRSGFHGVRSTQMHFIRC
jgi:hypothetical protein